MAPLRFRLPSCARKASRASSPIETTAPTLRNIGLQPPQLSKLELPDQLSEARHDEALARAPLTLSTAETSIKAAAPSKVCLETIATSAVPVASAPNMTSSMSVRGLVTLEMSGDMLCVRSMHVSYTDRKGTFQQVSATGYNAKVSLLPFCRDIEVSFSVLGGSNVCKVDRALPGLSWVRDEHGQSVPEKFVYTCQESRHLQYFVQGTSLHSFVSYVDERDSTESLLHLVSRDYKCTRSMHVAYTTAAGSHKDWSGTGHNVRCHLPSTAQDVEVTFSVVGGGKVYKVDRRDQQMPWIEDAHGTPGCVPLVPRPVEKFVYATCPPCMLYEMRGPSLGSYISRVCEQQVEDFDPDAAPSHCVGNFDIRAIFDVPPDQVPSIGGIVDLKRPHSEFLLPSEVALFEPSQAEIFHAGSGARQIFLNTPLTPAENAALSEMHAHLAKRGAGGEMGDFPKYMEQHALRMLQTCKFNVPKAVEMMQTCIKERLHRLPIAEADVEDDLRSGFIYWHGRDRKCRPCLVIRLERLGAIARDRERAVRAVMYTLEYALRYAMVPGRVENWVVIIDLANVMSVISPLHIGSLVSVATAIGTTLEKVYCGRMVWIKIINMPGGALLNRAINGSIPAEKKDKVGFPRDYKEDLAKHFEANQLEQRYGGIAPDLEPAETYPYHFFPRPRGELAVRGPTHSDALEMGATPSHDEVQDVDDFSLHECTNLAFHEGQLWDNSSEHARRRWLSKARGSSLTPASAEALTELEGGEAVAACRNMDEWVQIVNLAAVQHNTAEFVGKSMSSESENSREKSSESEKCSDESSESEEVVDSEGFIHVSLLGGATAKLS